MIGKINEYEIHPLCMLFPWLKTETMEILKEDIKKYGQRDTIKRLKGQIIDGKNRLRALTDLQLDPIIEDLPPETNIVAYVKAVGLCRRDLTPTKRIIISQKLDEYETERLPQTEKDKITKWKKDPEKRKILREKKIKKIATEAKSTPETVQKIMEIQEKGTLKAKETLKKLEEEDIKSVTKAHKEVVGITKKKSYKHKTPTRDQLIEDLTWYKYESRKYSNLCDRLIKFIKSKNLWDEIKGEFNISFEKTNSEPTPKQLRKAEIL